MPGTQEVINKLKGWGSQEGKDFVQSTRGGRHVAPGQVDEGFCQGVCIDWTRKVLQGGKTSYSETHESSQTLRQATIQIRIEDMDAEATLRVNLANDLVHKWNDQLPQYNSNNAQVLVQLTPLLETRLDKYFDYDRQPNHRYHRDKVKWFYTTLREMVSQTKHTTEVGWAAMAHNLDEYHSRKRTEENRKTPSRYFSNIKILKSAAREHYGNHSVESALNTLLQKSEFVRGTVLLMGFGLRVNGTDTGHAVAAYKLNTGEFLLFDPNYGVFRYASLSAIFTALMYLFGDQDCVYDSTPGWHVTGGVSYILFGT